MNNNEDFSLIPPYLLSSDGAQQEETQNQKTYGVLSYQPKRKCWLIKGDPVVTSLCKRLFPGSETLKRGEARFTNHRRIIGDLNWLMLRYPLLIRKQDVQRWNNALANAREAAVKKATQARKPSKALPNPLTFKGELTPFQQEGLAFLCNNERALLADEMGLGKTVQALAMLAKTSAYPAMIIAPSHLICNWKKEIERFICKENGEPLVVHVVKGLKPYPLPTADIYLMHYLLLRGWKESELAFPTILFDEIQELRHRGTEKYSSASLIAEKSERVFGLSGTPIYNRGAEIWNVINILDFHFLGDFESFSREWCYGYGNQLVQKPALLGELLKNEGMMLRRLKQDVLKDLPPKRRLVVTVDSVQSTYHQKMSELTPLIKKLKESTDNERDKALLKMEIVHGTRQATGISKAPYVVSFVRALLENKEKVLLFAHHHEVMDLYKKELKSYSPVFITGRETTEKKEKAIERFMSDKTNICCISLRAASGLNLQKATCVVFGELDWSPAVHSQAEDRAHRMGQVDSIRCYYLVSQMGADPDMQDALGLKVSQFVLLMGDKMQDPTQQFLNESNAEEYAKRLIEKLLNQIK